jgi:hypothetical protein
MIYHSPNMLPRSRPRPPFWVPPNLRVPSVCGRLQPNNTLCNCTQFATLKHSFTLCLDMCRQCGVMECDVYWRYSLVWGVEIHPTFEYKPLDDLPRLRFSVTVFSVWVWDINTNPGSFPRRTWVWEPLSLPGIQTRHLKLKSTRAPFSILKKGHVVCDPRYLEWKSTCAPLPKWKTVHVVCDPRYLEDTYLEDAYTFEWNENEPKEWESKYPPDKDSDRGDVELICRKPFNLTGMMEIRRPLPEIIPCVSDRFEGPIISTRNLTVVHAGSVPLELNECMRSRATIFPVCPTTVADDWETIPEAETEQLDEWVMVE